MGFWKSFGIGAIICVAPPLGLALLMVALMAPRRAGEVSPVHQRRRSAISAPPYAPASVWMNPDAYLPGSAFLHPDVDASSSSE
jgi:hypothetical protein